MHCFAGPRGLSADSSPPVTAPDVGHSEPARSRVSSPSIPFTYGSSALAVTVTTDKSVERALQLKSAVTRSFSNWRAWSRSLCRYR